MTSDFDVGIVGAGPVGLTLALELSRRGVSSVLIDRNLAPGPWPKMERCNARSMEIFRRLGLAETIRAAAQPPDGSMDIAIVSNLCDPPLALLEYPTVRQMGERIAGCCDGSLPLEPYQVVSQYTLEPILLAAVGRYGNIATRYGVTAESFEEGQDGIVLRVRAPDGPAAESCGGGRVLSAGDAGVFLIAAGGLGMNSGVGDAVDLAWKLAGAVQGWGGPQLLASYEIEGKSVGRRNRDASGFGTAGLNIWRSAFRPNIREDSADGAATRAEVSRLANVAQRRAHEMAGVELGYTYSASPLVCAEPGPSHESDYFHYIPSASPGSRLPHAWLSAGPAIQDVIGVGYTLLDFSQRGDTSSLQVAMRALGAPLNVVHLDEPQAHRVCGRRLVLLRPDAHVAWRGDELPADCAPIARIVTGNVTEVVRV